MIEGLSFEVEIESSWKKQIQAILDLFKEKGGMKELNSLVKKIEYEKQSKELGNFYGLTGKIASEWDPKTQSIIIYPEFFAQEDQEGILAHELGEVAISYGIIDLKGCQEIINEIGLAEKWESEWVTKLKEPAEEVIEKEVRKLKAKGQRISLEDYKNEWRRHKLTQMVCERFAAFLKSKDPQEMIIKRIEKMNPESQERLKDDRTSMKKLIQETEAFFNYFQNTLIDFRRKMKASLELKGGGGLWGHGLEAHLPEPAEAGKKYSFFQQLIDELEELIKILLRA